MWFSNFGRTHPPWSGRHLALGMEPVCAPFGLGPPIATADNPITAAGVPTALRFSPATPFVIRYSISADVLPGEPDAESAAFARHA